MDKYPVPKVSRTELDIHLESAMIRRIVELPRKELEVFALDLARKVAATISDRELSRWIVQLEKEERP